MALWLAGFAATGALAGTATQDVRQIGLAPLYEVLVAVANCRNVALDDAAFRRAARLYRLSPTDLTSAGRFPAEIADLAERNRIRFGDDPDAFCSVARLRDAVPHGVLIDLGPVVPHPLSVHLPRAD